MTDSCLCSEPKLRIPDLAQNRDWRVSWSHFAPQAKKITSFRDYALGAKQKSCTWGQTQGHALGVKLEVMHLGSKGDHALGVNLVVMHLGFKNRDL